MNDTKGALNLEITYRHLTYSKIRIAIVALLLQIPALAWGQSYDFEPPSAMFNLQFFPPQARPIKANALKFVLDQFQLTKLNIVQGDDEPICPILAEQLAKDFSRFLVSETPPVIEGETFSIPVWTPELMRRHNLDVPAPYHGKLSQFYMWNTNENDQNISVIPATLSDEIVVGFYACNEEDSSCEGSVDPRRHLVKTVNLSHDFPEELRRNYETEKHYALLYPILDTTSDSAENISTPRHQGYYKFLNIASFNERNFAIYYLYKHHETVTGDTPSNGFIIWPLSTQTYNVDSLCFFTLTK